MTGNATPDQEQRTVEAFDLSPAVFVENRGQWDPRVRYGFDGKGTRVSFTDAGPVFQMTKSDGQSGEVSQTVFSATFVGAKTVQPVGISQSPSVTNYYTGNDSSKWRRGVPSFQKVLYRGIYDGIDLCAWGKRSGLKYEFHVAPGASSDRIVVRYKGIDGLAVDDKGALHVRTSLGEIIDGAPVVYQETAGGRKEIASKFRLIDDSSYCFDVMGVYDKSLPIVIDPDLAWASYLGAAGYDWGSAIAVDASGNCYVTGYTSSSDFPASGDSGTTYGGNTDAFLAKVTSSGQLAWASYLGGADGDFGWGVAVDPSGDCFVTGGTASSDFPASGAFDTSSNGDADAFIAKVTSAGQLEWAGYLGGSGGDAGYAIAADASGNCYITGYTNSSDFPASGGFDASPNGDDDAFLAKVTSAGQLAWASYLGGSVADTGFAVAADASGNCYLTGYTYSSDFPVPGGFDTSFDGVEDAFVAKVTPSGQLLWASYLGGSQEDEGCGIATDAVGDCYIAGRTHSSDFPVPGGFDTSYNGGGDAFLAKVTSAGQLAWASYLGGGDLDEGWGVAVSASGDCFVTGGTASSDFPASGGFDTSIGSFSKAFVAKVTPSGTLAWGSYLGGSHGDAGRGIAAGSSGNCYVTGPTSSSDFPASGGLGASYGGDLDAFLAKVSPPLRWLEIEKLRLTLPAAAESDSFFLRGSLNMPFAGNAPRTVTLSIDGWSVVMDASSWKRVGVTNVYTCKEGGITGRMKYWVKGTSKCVFTFTAKKQSLAASMPGFPAVPVRLEVGGDFDKTVVAGMTLSNNVAKLSSVGPLPVFCTEKLAVTKNLRLTGHDALSFKGKVVLDGDFDPAADALTMNVGPYRILLPAGTISPAKNGAVKYTAPTAHGTLHFRLNNRTHVLTVTATGVDMSSVTQDTEVSLSITNHLGADWDCQLSMAKNDAGTVYGY